MDINGDTSAPSLNGTRPNRSDVPKASEWGRIRRTVFYIGAWLFTLLVGSVFLAVTTLTLALWFAGRNADTNPVTDLGFLTLGAMVTAGFVVQLRNPHQHIAGLQQSILAIVALGTAGLIGGRIEPLVGALILLVAALGLIALHPAQRTILKIGHRPSLLLVALVLIAAIPAFIYGGQMLVAARSAGPSCFFGRCAYGDRFAELAALALATVLLGLLAAARTCGSRLVAWSVGTAAIVMGVASIVWPGLPGAFGGAMAGAAFVWGVFFIVAAEREAQRPNFQ